MDTKKAGDKIQHVKAIHNKQTRVIFTTKKGKRAVSKKE